MLSNSSVYPFVASEFYLAQKCLLHLKIIFKNSSCIFFWSFNSVTSCVLICAPCGISFGVRTKAEIKVHRDGCDWPSGAPIVPHRLARALHPTSGEKLEYRSQLLEESIHLAPSLGRSKTCWLPAVRLQVSKLSHESWPHCTSHSLFQGVTGPSKQQTNCSSYHRSAWVLNQLVQKEENPPTFLSPISFTQYLFPITDGLNPGSTASVGVLQMNLQVSGTPWSWTTSYVEGVLSWGHVLSIWQLPKVWPKKKANSPGWCSSVDWASVCKPKGRWFNSQSGHMPGLWARSPVRGMWEATNQCISHTLKFSSLSFSLPPLLSKNK